MHGFSQLGGWIATIPRGHTNEEIDAVMATYQRYIFVDSMPRNRDHLPLLSSDSEGDIDDASPDRSSFNEDLPEE
jgi:hypothetical protein